MDKEAFAWLALTRLPETGPATINRLLDRFHAAAAVLEAEPQELHDAGLPQAALALLAEWRRKHCAGKLKRQVQADAALLSSLGAGVLKRSDPNFPPLLREIHQPPPLLYRIGAQAPLQQQMVAIVGSRKATAVGRETAFRLASRLTEAGLVVCSGLALGIDAAAHEGALAAGGATVAVTAVGIDRVYPRRHADLQQRIVDTGGVVVTESPPGSPPAAASFPRRNRIISGLCLGVVVVEAALRSGSLITARLALEQGREVFAVPGSLRNFQSRGCHALLRDGARLVESEQDVIEELFGVSSPSDSGALVRSLPEPPGLGADALSLWRLLESDSAGLDELAERSGLPAARLQTAVTELELFGHLEFRAGQYARVTP